MKVKKVKMEKIETNKYIHKAEHLHLFRKCHSQTDVIHHQNTIRVCMWKYFGIDVLR